MGRTSGLRRRAIIAESGLPLRPRDPGPSGPSTGPLLTVLAANLCRTEHDAEAQARGVLAVDADLLLLTEVTADTVDALGAAGLATSHPHAVLDPDEGYFGAAIASRHPLTDRGGCDLGGRRGHVADVHVDGTDVRVVPVHTQAPIHDHDVAVWHSTIEANAAVADDAPGPVVLAGDWNATGGHRRLRRALARRGLVDAQVRRGHRWFPTWPTAAHPLMWVPVTPVLTLDHVVVSPDVAVVGLERLPLPATDHLALRAALRLPAA
ncbi:endonuclease/exonuclease/phosphatase family protein [Iamia majanohamensis]|uniref:Endonuclease/exonuclease/phosphatase family protein n=1 Tax=Iamia majanohamensis TaxID=467976 RepID=A0AAE9Y894_9ACTN|nr:endonuclease/exonuclease/phosphatase family protein [Iamia majanohamensis]WCO68565.1 endonuclease/exonuclease/phosphatase family protein [Iamia majanohamensis]